MAVFSAMNDGHYGQRLMHDRRVKKSDRFVNVFAMDHLRITGSVVLNLWVLRAWFGVDEVLDERGGY